MSDREPSQNEKGEHLPAEQVKAALVRLLASEFFAEAEQQRRLLTFIVEETLAGRGERLKAYSIATEALGRPPTFDPQANASVRVLAVRLRRTLRMYYAARSQQEPVIIELPAGSYMPRFLANPLLSEPEPPAKPPAKPARPKARIPAGPELALAIGFVLLLVGIGYKLAFGSPDLTGSVADLVDRRARTLLPDPNPAPSNTLRPLVVVGAEEDARPGPAPDPGSRLIGDQMRREFAAALSRFDDLLIVRLEDQAGGAPPAAGDREVYRLALEGEAVGTSLLQLEILLKHRGSGDLVLTRRVTISATSRAAAFEPDGVIGRMVTELGSPYGVIFADARRRIAEKGEPSNYPCVAIVFDYWMRPTEMAFARATACVSRTIQNNPGFGPAYAAYVFLRSEGQRLGHDPDSEEEAASEMMLFAQRAVTAAPASARSQSALAAAYSFQGRDEDAARAAALAVQRNPYDPELVADYGIKLIIAGDLRLGLSRLRGVLAGSSVHPPLRRFFATFAAALLKNGEEAQMYAAEIPRDAGPLRHLALIAAAAALGNDGDLRRRWQAFSLEFPAAAADPQATLRSRIRSQHFVDAVMTLLVRPA